MYRILSSLTFLILTSSHAHAAVQSFTFISTHLDGTGAVEFSDSSGLVDILDLDMSGAAWEGTFTVTDVTGTAELDAQGNLLSWNFVNHNAVVSDSLYNLTVAGSGTDIKFTCLADNAVYCEPPDQWSVWEIASVTLSQVPLPAAAWLFGSALLGLGALKRKKA